MIVTTLLQSVHLATERPMLFGVLTSVYVVPVILQLVLGALKQREHPRRPAWDADEVSITSLSRWDILVDLADPRRSLKLWIVLLDQVLMVKFVQNYLAWKSAYRAHAEHLKSLEFGSVYGSHVDLSVSY